MDNLTHTLIGVVAAEVVARATRPDPRGLPEAPRRHALVAMGIIGGALPDIDLAWSLQAITGDKLGYLMHHRGHTHTVLGCLLLALLLYGAVRLWFHWRRRPWAAGDTRVFAGMSLLAVMVHLGMDALNVYGVHPFWPWDNRWRYGDSVFIIEPLYWLAAAPLLFVLRSRVARALMVAVLLLATLALFVAHRSWLPWWLVPLPAIACALPGRHLAPRRAVMACATAMLLVTASFLFAGRVAGERVARIAAEDFPAFRTLDRVLSPAPAHPFCWDLQLVQVSGDEYVVRQGRLSLLHGLDARQCPVTGLGTGRTAPFRPVAVTARAELAWAGEFASSRSRLVTLAQQDCDTRQMMRFVRVPFVVESLDHWLLGDLRFDREDEPGFAEEIFGQGEAGCRYNLPWAPPRADLLAP